MMVKVNTSRQNIQSFTKRNTKYHVHINLKRKTTNLKFYNCYSQCFFAYSREVGTIYPKFLNHSVINYIFSKFVDLYAQQSFIDAAKKLQNQPNLSPNHI